MNDKVVKQWIVELKAFAKLPSFRHLRFPMFMESVEGDLLSPEGILCSMHMAAGLGKWLPEEAEGKKLRGCVFYDGSSLVAPESVLKWSGITASMMSEVRRANGEDGFPAAIKLVESWLDESSAQTRR